MTMSSETANRYFQGKENVAIAIARRRIKTGGDVKAALALIPVTKPLVRALPGDGAGRLSAPRAVVVARRGAWSPAGCGADIPVDSRRGAEYTFSALNHGNRPERAESSHLGAPREAPPET